MGILKGISVLKNDLGKIPDEIGLALLFKEFYERLVYFSFQIIKDNAQAQDIAQDAFIKYWHNKEIVQPSKTAIKNYLYSTVRNASFNAIRHSKVVSGYITIEQAKPETVESPIIDAIIEAEVMAEIHFAVQSLPHNYRIVSMLGYFDGKKNQEIADELELSVNTIKKQKYRALHLLRGMLAPELFIILIVFVLKFKI